MDRFDAMRLFVRIVERRSFTLAANDMEVPRSTATKVIAQMEARLGVRLLPGLPSFFEQYPDIELSLSENDRWVDLVQEGVDCALRYGHLRDSELVARQVATLERLTCATPSYLEKFGTPADLDGMNLQRMVGLRSITTGLVTPLEFKQGNNLQTLSLPSALTVTGTESYLAGIGLGLGLAQVPRFHVEEDLREGNLVEILQQTPPPSVPVSLLYSRTRQLSPRVRAFIDWAVGEFDRRRTRSED